MVTGGAGFLGSHLCSKLVKQGHDVICVDSLYTGNMNNIKKLESSKNFTFVKADISKIITPVSYPHGTFMHLDQIYNLACPASPPRYQEDPIHTTKTNVIGTLHMLEIAEETGATILQASTSEVYGDPAVHPQVEEYWGNVNPIGIRSCYDEGKRVAETLCFDFKRQHDVDVKIIRIFNTYGPNMDVNDGRVVSNFITQALRDEPMTMYGDGSNSRSFQYVDDLIDGMTKLMNSKHTGPYNIGNPHEFTMMELANIVIEMTNSNSKLVYKDLPEDDPKKRKPDISKAEKDLDWSPKIDLRDGLKYTIEYFKNALGI